MGVKLAIFCFLLYILGGMGASMGYHRLLCHQSAQVPKWFLYLLTLIGLPLGTPVQWVGNHRAHHNAADTIDDPHSPIISGFWYAHCGWYIGQTNPFICLLYALGGPFRMFFDSFWRPRTNQQYVNLAKDIDADPFLHAISRPIIYTSLLLIYLGSLLFITYYWFQIPGLIALWICLVIIYNLGDSVDSFGHLFGEKKGKSGARNNRILGLLSFGDGWHANHHLNPKKAKHGQAKQFDLTYQFLRILKGLGIVKKIY